MTLQQQFNVLILELYGEQWPQVARHNAERISNGQISDASQLNDEHLEKLINGLKALKRHRQRARSQP